MNGHRYKRPESVLVVVYTAAGEVLLMERARPRGFWQSVTGSLKWGENARDAAQRELAEETGLLLPATRLIDCRQTERFTIVPPWRERYAPGTFYNTEHGFALQLPSRRMIRLDPQAHGRYRWLSASQAAQRASSWTNRQLIRRLLL